MADNLILIGFMAAGKDTVGREISRRTGMALLSLDRLIELDCGSTVADIFRDQGEAYFRTRERTALSLARRLNRTVVATGGGSVLDPRNPGIMRGMGRVICLKVSPDVAEKRLSGDRLRPLIRDRRRIRILLGQRRSRYDFADYAIDTSGRSPSETARTIIDREGIRPAGQPIPAKVWLISAGRRSYPVLVGHRAMSRSLTRAGLPGPSRRGVILTNPLVAALYLDEVRAAFQHRGLDLEPLVIPDGERQKTMKRCSQIHEFLLRRELTRSDMLVALGGGVITDLAGFAAATFKRGMRLVHIPTTLLAQVDAAVGGKTGINHRLVKNAVGAFYPPDAVICDTDLLKSLPGREFYNGLAEIVKYGFTCDAGLFARLERDAGLIRNRDPQALTDIVARCIAIKQRFVEIDEREEKGVRETLNFGHTVGHALETAFRYKRFSHGCAVAIGMAEEARRAVRRGWLDRQDLLRLIGLLEEFGLPTSRPDGIRSSAIRRLIAQDKKRRGRIIRLPRPVRIGRVVIKEESWKDF